MTLPTLLIVAAALIGIGLYGAFSQQSFVMLMMGLELILNGAMLPAVSFWALTDCTRPPWSPSGLCCWFSFSRCWQVSAGLGRCW